MTDSNELHSMIIFIYDRIDDIPETDRIEIYKMIYNVIGGEKIKEKTNGSYINFSDIPNTLIVQIFNILKSKIKLYENDLFTV